MIGKLFPLDVVTITASSNDLPGMLYPEEAALVERAVWKRRQEFTVGRLCAREALRQLGIRNFPLLVGKHREPLWPPGVVGSLSHCNGYCGVAVARCGSIIGLGLDVEPAEHVASEIIDLICTPDEKRWLSSQPDSRHFYWDKLIFSAKESVYKCYFPLTRHQLDFKDLEIQIAPQSGRFWGTLLVVPPAGLPDVRVFPGRFSFNDTHIFTAVTLTADDDPTA